MLPPKNSYNPITFKENILSFFRYSTISLLLDTFSQIQKIFKAIKKIFPHFDQMKQGRVTELLFNIVKKT